VIIAEQQNIILQVGDPLPDFSAENTIVIDTETSGLLRQYGARIVGIALSGFRDSSAYYIPIRHAEGSYEIEAVKDWLRPLFSDPARQWIFHNAKFDLNMFLQDGLEIKGRIIDTMLMAYAHNTNRFSYALDTVTKEHVPEFKHVKYEALVAYIQQTQGINLASKKHGTANYAAVPAAILGEYALEDIQATKVLTNFFRRVQRMVAPFNHGCDARSQRQMLENEFECARVLAEMEDTGVLIDTAECMKLSARAADTYEQQCAVMAECAGHAVDPLSWKDMWVNFERAGGKVTRWTKTKETKGKQKEQQYTTDIESSTRRPNWNAAALMAYLRDYSDAQGNPAYDTNNTNQRVFKYLIAYREAMLNNRINSTYFKAYLAGCDYENVLHGQFVQTGTLTGRLSSKQPNLQNLAKPGGTADQKTFEKFMEEKDEDAVNKLVRTLFIARPGCALVSCDFSQIEYRAAAWYSQDRIMIDNWKLNPKIDYHVATMELLGLDRDLCKTINFGTLYGMSANGLAAALNAMGRPTTKQQAQEILNLLWEKRPALKDLINSIGAVARTCGYIQNAYGRVVDVPVGREYVALNYLVQGHCGDMMRDTLVRVSKLIKICGWPVKLMLTAHDELIFEIPVERVAELAPQLAAEMCKCSFMDVPVLSDIEVGQNWAEMVSLGDWIKERKNV